MFPTRNAKLFWLFILAALLLSAGQLTLAETGQATNSLIINEFLASNSSGLADEDGDYSDWIELYNPGYSPINLAGWALTDDPDDPQKWPFPDISLGSRAYLVIFASGKDRISTEPNATLHTNFKLDQDGEFLALYNALDRHMQIAATEKSPQFQDVAYGRYGQRVAFDYLATATPGQPNDSALLWSGLTSEVQFSATRGFYETPFQLELTTGTPGAVIYYTLDGSSPTQAKVLLYQRPIPINQTTYVRAVALKPNFRPSPATTHSYIFLNNVLTQPAYPPGFPETWGTYRETYKIAAAGQPVPADYEMDPQIVNDPRYRETIKNDLKSLPSVSIVLDMRDFDIYSNPRERGRAWERPASIEFFDPTDPDRGFHINAGLRIQGDIGRQEYIPKHSFRLFFRNEYGSDKLEYPLFPDSPVETFDTLILRGGVQSSYVSVWTPRRRGTTYTRDEWLRASQIEMSGIGSHGIFVHLYLNGLYWGLYNLVERPDETFGQAYFNIDKDNWYAFNHDGIINGSQADVQKLFHDFITSPDPKQKYNAIKPILDTTAFADYIILNWYAGTGDWPQNNWYAGLEKSAGQLRYFIWDGELTWRDGANLHLGKPNVPGYLWPNTVTLFFEALIHDPDFKMQLADRLYHHLFNDGALTDANAQARWLRLNQVINRAIVAESARWGDTREETPLSRADWLAAVDNVWQQMEGNAAKLIAQARQAGYYPPLDPPLFKQQGDGRRLTLTLSASLPDTRKDYKIYYTTNGADPRLPGSGAVAPEANLYQAPLILTTATHIKARALASASASDSDKIWSALHEATFTPVDRQPTDDKGPHLQITEIMYNPTGQDDDEFIELKNNGPQAIDLSGASFEGIQYTFPADSLPLAPGSFIVLARNPEAFIEKYPGIPLLGRYEGQLSNKGETISLKDRQGRVIVSVTYADEKGWPISPDGRGDSLTLINPAGDPNNPKNWRASLNRYGSPGREDVPLVGGGLFIDKPRLINAE